MVERILILSLCCTGQAFSQEKIDFEKEVFPIFESRCIECHGGEASSTQPLRKPKAGLRLDGKSWILKGSEKRKVLVPGNAAESLLYSLTVLPPDDRDFMPAKGDSLSTDEMSHLKSWIDQGANFGSWVGNSEESEMNPRTLSLIEPSIVSAWRRLGENLEPLPESTLKKAPGRVSPIFPGSPLLEIRFTSARDSITDEVIGALEPFAEHLTQVRLGKTHITDGSLVLIGRMERLTHLDLHGTKINGSQFECLSRLMELQYLNLFDTSVTDEGLAKLHTCDSLTSIFLWKSRVTEDGVSKLREALPKAHIHHVLELPEISPETEDEEETRRRR